MAGRPRKKNTIYRIKYSAVRQETFEVAASDDDDAFTTVEALLQEQVANERDTLEHFVICSVEKKAD